MALNDASATRNRPPPTGAACLPPRGRRRRGGGTRTAGQGRPRWHHGRCNARSSVLSPGRPDVGIRKPKGHILGMFPYPRMLGVTEFTGCTQFIEKGSGDGCHSR